MKSNGVGVELHGKDFIKIIDNKSHEVQAFQMVRSIWTTNKINVKWSDNAQIFFVVKFNEKTNIGIVSVCVGVMRVKHEIIKFVERITLCIVYANYYYQRDISRIYISFFLALIGDSRKLFVPI